LTQKQPDVILGLEPV